MPKREVLRLAGLLACVALATSRLGLLAHELVGHGVTALTVGAQLGEVRLFWFAGGWIHYQLAEPSVAAALAVAMGGIAVELAVGVGLWLAARGGALGRRLVRGVGAALVLHGSWYLATGAWHGYGDGVLLYRELGAARAPVAIAAGLVTCLAGFAGAREVLGALAETLPRARVAGTIVAVLLAGGLHVGLAVGELWMRRDPAYARVMQPERERVVANDLDRWQREQAQRGAPVSPEARQVEQARLEQAHRTFPFAWVLGVAVLASVIAGAARARRGEGEVITRRLLVTAAIVAGVAICGVIVIGSLAAM